eukprot:352604-Chlamydomonas_euryale.AAC.2
MEQQGSDVFGERSDNHDRPQCAVLSARPEPGSGSEGRAGKGAPATSVQPRPRAAVSSAGTHGHDAAPRSRYLTSPDNTTRAAIVHGNAGCGEWPGAQLHHSVLTTASQPASVPHQCGGSDGGIGGTGEARHGGGIREPPPRRCPPGGGQVAGSRGGVRGGGGSGGYVSTAEPAAADAAQQHALSCSGAVQPSLNGIVPQWQGRVRVKA